MVLGFFAKVYGIIATEEEGELNTVCIGHNVFRSGFLCPGVQCIMKGSEDDFMRKSKTKLLSVLLSVLLAFGAIPLTRSAVSADGEKQLAAPQNPGWHDTSATWDAVPNATSYTVYLMEDLTTISTFHDLTSTSFNLYNWMLEGKHTYTFEVQAVAKGYANSEWSIGPAMTYEKILPEMSGVSIDESNVLHWDMVDGEVVYKIDIGDYHLSCYGGISADLNYHAKIFSLQSGTYDVALSAFAIDEKGYEQYQVRATWTGTFKYETEQATLDKPANLRWEGTVAAWDAPMNGQRYVFRLYEGETLLREHINTYELKEDVGKYLLDGEHTYHFEVQAGASEYNWSDWAVSPDLTYNRELPELKNVVISEDLVLTWDAMDLAKCYVFTVGSVEGIVEGTSLDLKEICWKNNFENGKYNVTLCAFDNVDQRDKGRISATWSSEINYESDKPAPTGTPTKAPGTPTPSVTGTPAKPSPTTAPGEPTSAPKPTTAPGEPTVSPTPTTNPGQPTVAPTPYPPVTMPDVVGMDCEEAQEKIKKVLCSPVFDEVDFEFKWVENTDPEKSLTVLEQDPAAGNQLYGNHSSTTVTLVVAKAVEEKDPTFEDFVERLYVVALGRASEPAGKNFWVEKVGNGEFNGADCARFFLLDAPEFMNRGLSVDDFVETLYKTFFDRESDAAGKAGWVDAIKTGKMTRAIVVENFIESTEWCNVCATYGVRSGAQWHKAEFASKNAINFATRLYTCCLGRAPEEKGLQYWALALTNLEQTGCSAAKEFFNSREFNGLKTTKEEFVKRLYTTFMDRIPEDSEVAYWVGTLNDGTKSRNDVLSFFGSSEEFTKICKKYGIERGTI